MYKNTILAALAANPNTKFREALYKRLDAVDAGGNSDLRRAYKRVYCILTITHKIMLEHPTWRFYEGLPTSSLDYSTKVIIHDADDVYLGEVWVDYDGYHVKNHRTAAQAPTKGYRSASTMDKAVTLALKNFGPATHKELAQAAFDKAYESIRYRCERMSLRAENAADSLQRSMLEFCRDPEIFKLFVERAKTIPTWGSVLNDYTKYSAMLTTAQCIKDALCCGTATLILRVENEYVVRRLDAVSVYNDTSLPVEYREQLGMLKLSNVDKYLEGIGVRVAEDVFVLGEKQNGEATNE